MIYKDFVNSKTFNVGYYGVKAIILYLVERFMGNQDLEYKVYTDELNRADSYGSLLITSKYDWETKFRGKRPAIFVSRGNLLTGANGTVAQSKLFSVTDNGETTSYMDLVSFPIVIECLAESDIESEALGSMIATFIGLDVRPLRGLGLQIQGGITQTPPLLFEKDNISFISSVVIQAQISRQYRARIMGSETLQKIKTLLNQKVISEIDEDTL
jgi:hypothetical protein